MNAQHKPTRGDRVEGAVRWMVLCVLLAAAAWAWASGGGAASLTGFGP